MKPHARAALAAIVGLLAIPRAMAAEPVVCARLPVALPGAQVPVRAVYKPDRLRYLPKTMQRLMAGDEIQVVTLGDSIIGDMFGPQEGGNRPHASTAWGMETLAGYYDGRIWTAVAVRGSTGAWWYREAGRVQTWVLDLQPDLVVIGGISNQGDIDAIRDVVQQLRTGRPQVEIILMTGAVSLSAVPLRSTLRLDESTDTYEARLARLADELRTGFINVRGSYDEFVMEANRADPSIGHDHFQRDPIHANQVGRELLRQIFTMFFTGTAPCTDRRDGASVPAAPLGLGTTTLRVDGGAVTGIASADLDGDGQADLAFARRDAAPSALLGPFVDASGAAAPLRPLAVARITLPALALADLDASGRPDVVGADAGGAVTAVPNPGSIAPIAPGQETVVLDAGARARSVATLDADNDGRMDVVASTDGAGIRLYVSPAGRVAPPAAVVTLAASRSDRSQAWMVAADFDGDGRTDLAAIENGRSGDAFLRVFMNGPRGLGAGGSRVVPLPRFSATAIAALDLDADRDVDLVLGTPAGTPFIYALLNSGRAEPRYVDLVPLPKRLATDCTRALAAADLRGDATPILVALSGCSDVDRATLDHYAPPVGAAAIEVSPAGLPVDGDAVGMVVGEFRRDGGAEIATVGGGASAQALVTLVSTATIPYDAAPAPVPAPAPAPAPPSMPPPAWVDPPSTSGASESPAPSSGSSTPAPPGDVAGTATAATPTATASNPADGQGGGGASGWNLVVALLLAAAWRRPQTG